MAFTIPGGGWDHSVLTFEMASQKVDLEGKWSYKSKGDAIDHFNGFREISIKMQKAEKYLKNINKIPR